jgi:monofunctional glycosyltransferase
VKRLKTQRPKTQRLRSRVRPRFRLKVSWQRILLICLLSFIMLILGLILLYRVVPPVSTLMLKRWVLLESVDRRYVPLTAMSPHVIEAVLASEDTRFCAHGGVDWKALFKVIQNTDDEGPARGASTLTMQVSKNLFLWHGRSYVRKALEIPLSASLDLSWSKRRILEVYLNIAEWGEGVFGIEAAARSTFGVRAADLTPYQARLLVTALPAPLLRDASAPDLAHRLRSRHLGQRIAREALDLSCLE